MKLLILLYFVACFVQAFSQTQERKRPSPSYIQNKNASCPKPRFTSAQCAAMTFPFMCNVDSDCKSGQKCCTNGCVGECVSKINGNVASTEATRTCPAPPYTQEQCQLIRFVSCINDASCTTGQKCCNNGCGKQCLTTAKTCTKRGVCPSGNVNCIRSMCKSDCDCPGAQKCCYGCMCTKPATSG